MALYLWAVCIIRRSEDYNRRVWSTHKALTPASFWCDFKAFPVSGKVSYVTM